MMVTLIAPKDAAPIPWKNLIINKILKSRERAHAPPAIPKRNMEGMRILFLPYLSAKTPSIGVKMTPGSVKTVISNPIPVEDIPNAWMIFGKAGVMLATPITAIRVMPKMM